MTEHKKFDILINIEGSARLSWVYRDQYTLNPQGAVASGEETLRTFIARRTTHDHNTEGSLTHTVGNFNPKENFGVFHVVDQNNKEIKFQDGEILVETEPISYEFKSVKFDRLRSRYQRRRVILGETLLKNTELGTQRVDTVISYSYPYSLFWGKGHGLLTGLNFTVHLSNGTNLGGNWGIRRSEEVVATKPIEIYLEEGTGVNVTLYGNNTESEVPYSALVVALYKDGERKEKKLTDIKREKLVTDLVVDFGPVFYLHNNSHVPTTTTTSTTTTTTTTTTFRTTSTTQEAAPIVPPVVSDKKRDDTPLGKKQENNSMMSDDGHTDTNASELKEKTDDKPSSSGRHVPAGLLLLIGVMARCLT